MPRLRTVLIFLAIATVAAPPLSPQSITPAPPPAGGSTAPQASAPAAKHQAELADKTGGPEILVPASENSFTYTVSLTAAAEPIVSEIRPGQLTNPDHPTLEIVPSLTAEPPVRSGSGWSVPIRVSGLIPFGSSTLPLFYESRKIDTIRVLKNGISVEGPTTPQNQGNPLLLVLRNPSDLHYTSVRARLRFQGKDICTFSVEKFIHQPTSFPATQSASKQASMPSNTAVADTKALDQCNEVAGWTDFEIPGYSGISLRTLALPDEWFNAPAGYSLAVSQKGTLTLRFSVEGSTTQTLQEQVVPVEIQFQPGTVSRSLGYVRVGTWLLLGALFSLVLRIAIPNYRRLRSIRDQLDEIYKNTRGISEEVDSMLRVQLRVERLSLTTLAGSVLVVSPGFGELATRVEAAMATLRRRIDYVRRLDAALNRRQLLIADELAQPTRIAAIDRSLNTASEELKSDQFREQDWVFIQQALEAADKILGNPSEEDKSTFETVLIQRWQSISRQYGFTPDAGWTSIPPSLAAMTLCFPKVEILCPKGTVSTNQSDPAAAKQADTIQWIKSVGTVRADLQITALELIREFQFLAPAVTPPSTGATATPPVTNIDWQQAMNKLIPWLATPAFENLNNARLLLRELSEGISPENIVTALQNNEAHIELDPQVVGSGERVHLAIRFWRLDWNSAAARQQIVCEWRFKAVEGTRQSGTPQAALRPSDSLSSVTTPAEQAADDTETPYYREKGWEVYHYFEERKGRYPMEVLFYSKGKLVMDAKDPSKPLIYPYVLNPQSRNRKALVWEQSKRVVFESLELFAALLVPLCALAVSTADKGSSSQWWQLLGLGFGSDTIRNVLSSTSDPKPPKSS